MALAEHYHTGRRLERRHTSYAALVFALLVAGVVLAGFTANTLAVENPQSGSIGVGGVMNGPPPKRAATILQPTDGQHFTNIPIDVSGVCDKGLVVEIFKNDVFAGSTVCDNNGKFALQIDLFAGANRLVARVFDALNQQGPDSNVVTVYYDQPGVISGNVPPTEKQMVLISDTKWQGVSPAGQLTWPVEIVGGQAPYALSWDWGDGKIDPFVRPADGKFSEQHTYAKPGVTIIRIKASDNNNHNAYLQLAVIVNGGVGQGSAKPADLLHGLIGGNLLLAWPLFVLAAMMVATFWLGERWELRRLRGRVVEPVT